MPDPRSQRGYEWKIGPTAIPGASPDLSGNPKAERTLEGEAVRQLAQFAASGDNSDTGYLELLNRDRQQERRAFYERALQQWNDGVFGDRLKEKLNSVLRKVSRLKSLRGGQ